MFAEVRTSTLEELKFIIEQLNDAMYALSADAVNHVGALRVWFILAASVDFT